MCMHVNPHTPCQHSYMYIYMVCIPYALSFCSTHMQLGITTVKKIYILTKDRSSSRNRNIWDLAIINSSHLLPAFIRTHFYGTRKYLSFHVCMHMKGGPSRIFTYFIQLIQSVSCSVLTASTFRRLRSSNARLMLCRVVVSMLKGAQLDSAIR